MSRDRFKKLFDKAEESFDKKFGSEINSITDLSELDLDKATPNLEDRELLKKIQLTVKDATQKNLSQAEVIENIKKIGDKAVDLVKKNFPKIKDLFD